jgi:hypothetical protein
MDDLGSNPWNGVWQDAYMCIPPDCLACDNACAFVSPYSSSDSPDPSAQCKFNFCDPTDDWVGSKGASGSAGGSGGSSGHTTVAPPTVNCSSYSFPGCSAVGSSAFANSCINAGCHFSLGAATTHGDFDSPTYECRCY